MFFYIHIPFCRQKCQYCKFALTPKFDELKISTYLHVLKKEIGDFFESNTHVSVETIYFGGGTPSILTAHQLEEILSIFRRQPGSQSLSEITLESNPEDITREYLRSLYDIWINRLSLGVQTFNTDTLRIVWRSDSNTYIFSALKSIAEGPIENISCDLIVGLPHTSPWQIVSDLTTLFEIMSPKHMSIYMLEDETYPKNWKPHLGGEETVRSEYLAGALWLKTRGFEQYEISNFAKPGFASKHNTSYWNHSPYRGFGLSAASYIDGSRSTNHTSFSGYYQGKHTIDVLSSESLRIERIMFGLRTCWVATTDLDDPKKVEILLHGWLIEKRENKVFLTSTWIFLIDYIIGELI